MKHTTTLFKNIKIGDKFTMNGYSDTWRRLSLTNNRIYNGRFYSVLYPESIVKLITTL